MKDYLIKKRPRISIYFILLTLISTILISFTSEIRFSIERYIDLFPSNLNEPWNWYRLITYSLFSGDIKSWMFNSLAILLFGYVIESRFKKYDLIGLMIISSVIGGLFYLIFNPDRKLDIPMNYYISTISWGYCAALIVIGVKTFRTLILFEKIILILGFIRIVIIFDYSKGFMLDIVTLMIIIMILTLIRKKNWAQ